MRTITTAILICACLAAFPAGAQTTVGAGAAAPTIQSIAPASGTGQVRQPPANSAMRDSGSGATGAQGAAGNPMGMAGLGMAGSNALSLSGTAGGGQGAGGGQADSGAQATRDGRGGAGRGQAGVSISDTGVTRRIPTGNGASGQQQ